MIVLGSVGSVCRPPPESGPRFTRALAVYEEPRCLPFLAIVRLPWSGMVSQTLRALYIFRFAAVKRGGGGGAPPSLTAARGRKWGSSVLLRPLRKFNLKPSLDARGQQGPTPVPPLLLPRFIAVTRRPHPSSLCCDYNGLLLDTVVFVYSQKKTGSLLHPETIYSHREGGARGVGGRWPG